ncbi:MAG TPA: hypothetical protein VN516_06500, partial [Candidatus Baltobacteraceae bacterium]|nr:hypothetical protein [Candidatus Baltobacteraceae bacterium]
KTLKAFADKTPWVCSLHYWSINDDAARPRKKRVVSAMTNEVGTVTYTTNRVTVPSENSPWQFVKVFQSFTSR